MRQKGVSLKETFFMLPLRLLVFLFLLSAGMPAVGQIGIGLGTGGIGVGFNLGGGHRDRPAPSPNGEVRYLKDQLDLSDGQVVAVRQAIQDRESYRSRRQKQENHQRFEEDMKDILTPEQHAKYLEIRQQAAHPKAREKAARKEVPASQWDDVYQ